MPCPYAAQFHDVAADFHAELLQQQLAHRAARHARHGLPRARALQDVPSVLPVVLERAREVRVARAGPRDLAPPPYPPMRRRSSVLIRSVGTARPAGIPSRIPTRPRPCDSPAVVNRNVTPAPYGRLKPRPGRAAEA